MYLSTDLTTFERIDRLLNPETPDKLRITALFDSNWRIVQAALQAIGQRPTRDAIDPIMAVLDGQDDMQIYGETPDGPGDTEGDDQLAESRRCRFRIKQAACLTLGEICASLPPETVAHRVMIRLVRYATSQTDDYPVRSAACRALGRIGDPIATAALQSSSMDGVRHIADEAELALARLAPVSS